MADSSTRRPRIVVTNDDGITAKGIQSLAEAMTEFGDVYVIAPDSPQSGMGHAVTFSRILRLHPFEFERGSTEARSCSGTPVDCVKLAMAEVFGEDDLPDLLVSGINHGSNASINVIYSGTMSAAVEGAMCGIPSIGFFPAGRALGRRFHGLGRRGAHAGQDRPGAGLAIGHLPQRQHPQTATGRLEGHPDLPAGDGPLARHL